ncbi:MAG: DUF3558 domain-containing protein, partial [Actinomycetota bacterium]|nr:DUF3558 domain-containing protein [Actinomycetota bacterium]
MARRRGRQHDAAGRVRTVRCALLARRRAPRVAGCSSTEAGAQAAPTPADPIPAVAEPKDISGVAPCDLLTGEQLASAGFDQAGGPGKFQEISGIPSCLWRDSADTRRLTTATILDRDALRNLYLYQQRTYQVLELTEVAGHPALRTQVIAGGNNCVPTSPRPR